MEGRKAPPSLLYPKRPGRGKLRWIALTVGVAAVIAAIVVGVSSISSGGGGGAPEVTDGGGVPVVTSTPAPGGTYQLIAYVDGSGSISPSGGVYSQGDAVTLTAIAASGWLFDHWSGDASGTSTSVTVRMTSVKHVTAHFVKVNPPIRVVLDKVQAIEDCEPFFMAPGDFYFHVTVTDGRTSSQQRIPASSDYPLYDGDTKYLNRAIFSTSEVGDYVQVVIVGFEADEACFSPVVIKALAPLADWLVPGAGTGALLALQLIEQEQEVDEICIGEDDYAGGFDETWYSSQNWGVGSHQVTNQYMRFWITIERP